MCYVCVSLYSYHLWVYEEYEAEIICILLLNVDFVGLI